MKRLVLIVSLLLTIGLVCTAESNYLHIAIDNGWEVIDTAKADRLTFKGGIMTVNDVSGNVITSYDQASLERMYIDQTMSVTDIISSKTDAPFKIIEHGRFVELLGTGAFEVYNLHGVRLVKIARVTTGKTVNLSGLKSGVYIYRLGDYAIKCIIN